MHVGLREPAASTGAEQGMSSIARRMVVRSVGEMAGRLRHAVIEPSAGSSPIVSSHSGEDPERNFTELFTRDSLGTGTIFPRSRPQLSSPPSIVPRFSYTVEPLFFSRQTKGKDIKRNASSRNLGLRVGCPIRIERVRMVRLTPQQLEKTTRHLPSANSRRSAHAGGIVNGENWPTSPTVTIGDGIFS